MWRLGRSARFVSVLMKLLERLRLLRALRVERPWRKFSIDSIHPQFAHLNFLNTVLMEKQALQLGEVVQALYLLDTVILQPEAFQVNILIQVLNL